MEMEDTSRIRPSVCFEVQKIIGVSIDNGNLRNYQVQWAPTWVSGFHLVGCENLIEEFLEKQSEKNQFVDDTMTTHVTNTNNLRYDDLQNEIRENVPKDNDVSELTSRQQSTEHIHEQASMVVNDELFPESQESNSVLYSNTSNDIINIKVETNVVTNMSNDEICTSDIDGSNETNPNLELVKVEDMSHIEYENNLLQHLVCNNPPSDNDKTTDDASDARDGTSFDNVQGKHHIENNRNNISKFQQSNTCLYSSISTEHGTMKVETNVSNEEICTNDIDTRNQTNSTFEWVKVAEELVLPLSLTYENISTDTDNSTGNADGESEYGKHRIVSENELENNFLVIEREEIMSETGPSNFNKTKADNNDSSLTEIDQNCLSKPLKTYECNLCQKVYKYKPCFIRHMKEAHHKCQFCKEMFPTSSKLKRHTRLHTGDRWYVCEVCRQAYKRKEHLTRHSLTHTMGCPSFSV